MCSVQRTPRHSLLLLLLLPLAAPAACSDDDCNELFGSSAKTYNLDFNDVRIRKQVLGGTFQAMYVEYVQQGKSQEYLPVKLVANAPVEAGEKKEISGANGALVRVMPQGGIFPKINQGNVTFSTITPGEHCTGEFYVTFEPRTNGSTKTTLNGRFCGTVVQVGDKT